MKKILLINQTKASFSKRFEEYVNNNSNAEIVTTFPNEMALLLENNTISLYIQDTLVDPKEYIPFVRAGFRYSHFVSVVYHCADLWDWRLNDTARKYADVYAKKAMQLINCIKVGVPVLKSILVTYESLKSNEVLITNKIGFPLVVKGYEDRGTEVFKIHSYQELLELDLDVRKCYVLQEYVDIPYDIRVLVYNGKILGAMKRSSQEFLHNYSKGGLVEEYYLHDEEKRIAPEASEATNISFAGVDIIHKDGKSYILEVNLSPQIKGFEQATGLDIVKIIASDILDQD